MKDLNSIAHLRGTIKAASEPQRIATKGDCGASAVTTAVAAADQNPHAAPHQLHAIKRWISDTTRAALIARDPVHRKSSAQEERFGPEVPTVLKQFLANLGEPGSRARPDRLSQVKKLQWARVVHPPMVSSPVDKWLLIDIRSGAVLACFTLDRAA